MIIRDKVRCSRRSASKSLFVPLPTGGPAFRYYLLPSRLYVDGAISGMYLFGYGNFISTSGILGVSLGHHLSLRAVICSAAALKFTARPTGWECG